VRLGGFASGRGQSARMIAAHTLRRYEVGGTLPVVKSWLTPAGWIAAVLVGAVTAAGAGWRGFAILLVFLAGSSLLTPGGGQRRAVQVLANGAVAALCALAGRWHPAFLAAFAGAMAAAAADTWSTEIGSRSRAAPRLITTGRPVEPGTSGGITLLGTAGGLLGALVVAGACIAVGLLPAAQAAWIAAAGLAGTVADSLLGASLQARWWCERCARITEDPRHACAGGAALERRSGWPWMTNDAVNLLASLTGALLALAPAALAAARLP